MKKASIILNKIQSIFYLLSAILFFLTLVVCSVFTLIELSNLSYYFIHNINWIIRNRDFFWDAQHINPSLIKMIILSLINFAIAVIVVFSLICMELCLSFEKKTKKPVKTAIAVIVLSCFSSATFSLVGAILALVSKKESWGEENEKSSHNS